MVTFYERLRDGWRPRELPARMGYPNPEAPVRPSGFVAGLDLGQSADYSALAILEQRPPGDGDPRDGGPVYHCRHIARWPLRTSYVAIGEDVARLLTQPPLVGHTQLFVDHTGVGAGPCDILERIGLRREMTTVQITSGRGVTRTGPGAFNVAKVELISGAQVALQNRRLRIAPQLREASALIRELETYQVKITDAGLTRFGQWREGQHDDMLLALVLALWGAESGAAAVTRFF